MRNGLLSNLIPSKCRPMHWPLFVYTNTIQKEANVCDAKQKTKTGTFVKHDLQSSVDLKS